MKTPLRDVSTMAVITLVEKLAKKEKMSQAELDLLKKRVSRQSNAVLNQALPAKTIADVRVVLVAP